MKRPDWWLLLECVAFISGILSLAMLILPEHHVLHRRPFLERVGEDPTAFVVMVASFGFILYSSGKVVLSHLSRRKP